MSVSSNNDYIPWQYNWKRPRITPTKSSINHSKELHDKIPINTSSARLTSEEASILLLNCSTSEDEENERIRMKWEDLESESEDENGDSKLEPKNEICDEYIVTVTTFASKSFIKLLQAHSAPSEKVIVPGDTILLEVIRDSHRLSDIDDLTQELDENEVDVIMSKILYWPSSALVDPTLSNPEEHEFRVNFEDERKTNGPLKIWESVQDVLKLPKSVANMSEEEKESFYQRQAEKKFKSAKAKIGVTNVLLCRQASSTQLRHLEIDEIMDVLDRLSLNLGLEIDHDLLATKIETNAPPETFVDVSQDLILTCLSNDGKVQIFSVLDLLIAEKSENDHRDELGGSDKKLQSEEDFINSFETLILGHSLKKSLEKTFLPLSRPKYTLELSVVKIKGRIVDDEEKEVEEMQMEDNKTFDHRMKKIKEFGVDMKEFRPHLDFSLLDSNIESSTVHDRTFNNIPSICTFAHGFIVVGGSGIRKRRTQVQKQVGEDTKKVWKNISLGGGFISLISTYHCTETKTIFLPFSPRMIYPVRWNSMDLIIVLGKNANECMTIRSDASSYVNSLSQSKLDDEKELRNRNFDFVRKFVPLKICFDDLDDQNSFPVSIGSMSSTSPSILMCTLDHDEVLFRRFEFNSFSSLPNSSSIIGNNRDSNTNPRVIGKYCISSRSLKSQFMSLNLSSYYENPSPDILDDFTLKLNYDSLRCLSGNGWMLVTCQMNQQMHLFCSSLYGATDDDGAYYEGIGVLNNENYAITDKIQNFDFVIPIRPSPQRQTVDQGTSCQSSEQIVVCSGRLDPFNTFTVSMRRKAIYYSHTTRYKDVIAWLFDKKDFITATVIALKLLGDFETIYDLEGVFSVKNGQGWLDGITEQSLQQDDHVYNSRRSRTSESLSTAVSYRESARRRTQVHLSNLAVKSMINGGSSLAHALEKFLGRNEHYDSVISCSLLVNEITKTIENFRTIDLSHLATYSYDPMESENHALWPIQCLLRIAVSRDCMQSALGLLNDSIPEELRHRCETEDENSPRSSLMLSKSIISMILASSDIAGSVLMDLHEKETGLRFWESLDEPTKLSLSILHVQGRYPFLREKDVRDWAVKILHSVTDMGERDNKNEEDLKSVPTEWLREICTGVLSNAGCDLSQTILFTPALLVDGICVSEKTNTFVYQQLKEEEEDLYDYLTAAPGCGGIDFDLIIPSFLILEDRNAHWISNEKVPTQAILNIVCDLAGRHSTEEPKFPFDSKSVMKQCVRMNNAQSGANLIGGQDGLLLKCAYILSTEFSLSMKDAEMILRRPFEKKPPDGNETFMSSFELTDTHKTLIFELEKYCLRAKKFGDFYKDETCGFINPVFAGRLCLRTWLELGKKYPSSLSWLQCWLADRLNIGGDVPANRLPSAAIVRSLLWNSSKEDESEALAVSFGFDLNFLVQLTKNPLGLLESVEPNIYQ
ncbi:hypothetical protein CTEN210_07988 [Chaetoceros tenuissimus]|uniref:Uncharacterized protein n=1 Tax=Chaetoceros tenuissimus TaxID=426638 RepID=A0AAD3H5M7_9STRA|nr:hypothetical protein CTEN210_07988 [Chaetoceros tenuissimus]